MPFTTDVNPKEVFLWDSWPMVFVSSLVVPLEHLDNLTREDLGEMDLSSYQSDHNLDSGTVPNFHSSHSNTRIKVRTYSTEFD